MAIHEFKCNICGYTGDYSWHQDAPVPLHCKQQMVKVYKCNFILKGEGWSKQNWEKPNEEIDAISIKKER